MLWEARLPVPQHESEDMQSVARDVDAYHMVGMPLFHEETVRESLPPGPSSASASERAFGRRTKTFVFGSSYDVHYGQ